MGNEREKAIKPMNTWLDTLGELGAVMVLVLLNGFFVAAEFALVGSRRTYLEQIAAEGNRAAALVRTMLDDLDRYIAHSSASHSPALRAAGSVKRRFRGWSSRQLSLCLRRCWVA